jgi:hypothetical protein
MVTSSRCHLIAALLVLAIKSASAWAETVTIEVQTPLAPPAWALLERELLSASAQACEAFFARYFDERGFLRCVERWGGDDGPDDAIENLTHWPILYAIGAPEVIRQLYTKGWEGHLRQYTQARTVQVPMARDGMYYKEFPVMFDWLHNGEGLTVFNLMGLADPHDPRFQERVRRYAGFYMNEDPQAPNYDPTLRIIKSLMNGSRGPMLRQATGIDWAGDLIDVRGRFRLRHGENDYEQMLAHFKDYNDVVGDHPSNLSATTLALDAYMLTHEEKYKTWLLDYVEAWRARTLANGGIIPSKVGLNGKVGGEAGPWYAGVYGWNFGYTHPVTGQFVRRNTTHLALIGFSNAFLLTGDDRYLDIWRKQIAAINAQGKRIDGQMRYPHMYGKEGWHDFQPSKYADGADELWYWSMKEDDRQIAPRSDWMSYLAGQRPGYPEQALRSEFERLRTKVEEMRRDTTTPETRLADDPLGHNPATVDELIHLVLGGISPGNRGTVLHSRVRYFDQESRRVGLPPDVAALVEGLTATSTTLQLVNLNQIHSRTVIVQSGAYAEHSCDTVSIGRRELPVRGPCLSVHLAPGCGAKLVLAIRRYVNPPTLSQPWDR